MTTPEARSGFEERWHDARYHDDLTTTIDLIIEAYASGDPPPWLEEEQRRLWGQIASALDADPDGATDLGHHALRLASVRAQDYPLGLLGLASIGAQPAEPGVGLDPRLPDLLHEMLARYDAVPDDAHTEYVRRWRELAVHRIATLVRLDQEWRVARVRTRYLRAVAAVHRTGVGAARPADLAAVRDGLIVLTEAHHRLAPFVTLLDQGAERDQLFDDVGAC